MENKKILLVEDDFLNRRLSKKILLENGYEILEAKNATEALNLLKNSNISLTILDINLGEGEEDGISIGKEITDRYKIPIIYLTAYENSEIFSRAVTTNPHSYLTKPFKNVDLVASVEIAIRQFTKSEKILRTILVRDGEYNIQLPINEIDHIESNGNYILFHACEKIYKNRYTMKQIMDILPQDAFIQVHRAFVVNKLKIEKYNGKTLIVKNKVIPISKNYISDIWDDL